MPDDHQLLEEYARGHSESAFGELVTRYLELVYSTALRVANGDTPLAEDVTQTVFIDLARKAPALGAGVVLASWLYRRAWYAAANAVRTERRRRNREQIALAMSTQPDDSEAPWERVAPHLDESLNQLSAADRDAIVLRFLKRQDFRAVGAALRISEDAAQKRVSRALEKLRGVLSRRGVELTATALASGLAANSATATPVGLAASVIGASLAGAACPSAWSLVMMKLMAMTKLKTAMVLVVLAGAATPAVLEHQANARLREANRELIEQTALLKAQALGGAVIGQTAKGATPAEGDQFLELMQLRAQVGILKQQVADLAKLEENRRLHQARVPAGQRSAPGIQASPAAAMEDACIANLKKLDGAKESWALEKKKKWGDVPTFEDIVPGYIRDMPVCPAGGQYILNAVGTTPECTVPDHRLSAGR